jgi:hypothetical protein
VLADEKGYVLFTDNLSWKTFNIQFKNGLCKVDLAMYV